MANTDLCRRDYLLVMESVCRVPWKLFLCSAVSRVWGQLDLLLGEWLLCRNAQSDTFVEVKERQNCFVLTDQKYSKK